MSGDGSVITVFVYRYPDGNTQLRCADSGDRDLVRDMLHAAIDALDDGTPVTLS